MAGADSAKKILAHYNETQYAGFSLNNDKQLTLPAISVVPGIGAGRRVDVFEKTYSHYAMQDVPATQHVRFITKNDKPHAFLWQTNSSQLQQSVRWGIIKPESVSGKVIAALGQYRIKAHDRIAKGMSSNTQTLKLKLLDNYQSRFEALQEMELLVNKDTSTTPYEEVITRYIDKLTAISQETEMQLAGCGLEKMDADVVKQIRADIAEDSKRAKAYLLSLKAEESLRAYNRSRGHKSVLEFVKQQMMHNLYELQGINQDITYSNKRRFALTRGEFNDFIEDARKEIDDYSSDPRNAITQAHHGVFASNPDSIVTYDFSKDNLSIKRQREVLLAISFIEGWDHVDTSNVSAPIVSNEKGSESVDIIYATRWQTHRNAKAFFKSLGFYLINIIKGFFVKTTRWEEEAWDKPDFHLFATQLIKKIKQYEPIWLKPIVFIKQLAHAVVDVFKGIRDFGAKLTIKMPAQIVKDWMSSKRLPDSMTVYKQAEHEIVKIRSKEDERLKKMLLRCSHLNHTTMTPPTYKMANAEYHLTAGEQHDLLNSMVRGVGSFADVFTHGIFAKDPIAGLLFTSTYAVGGAAIFFPAFTSSIFGTAYVNWFSNFAYSLGSSKIAAVIAGGSTQAQVFASSWDLLLHGPTSLVLDTAAQLAEDPLTVATFFGVAYGIGYLLANGIAGHTIPWLSEALKADLGTNPEAGYPFIGAKIAVVMHEIFQAEPTEAYHPIEFTYNGKELDSRPFNEFLQHKKTIERYCMARWLSDNASNLPKLRSKTLFNIERCIDSLFTKEEASSLKKILYPESNPSIAFQLVAIPLAYIPAVLRVVISLFLSIAALVMRNRHPLDPIKKAGGDLLKKVAYDLNRLLLFALNVVNFVFNILSSLFKMVAFTLGMAVSRVAGFANWHPGHALHRGLSAVHVFFRAVGEFFYPARATKSRVVANPTYTVKTVEESYTRLIQSLVNKKTSGSKESGNTDEFSSKSSSSPFFSSAPAGFTTEEEIPNGCRPRFSV